MQSSGLPDLRNPLLIHLYWTKKQTSSGDHFIYHNVEMVNKRSRQTNRDIYIVKPTSNTPHMYVGRGTWGITLIGALVVP